MSYQPASSSITMMPMASLSAAGNNNQSLNRGGILQSAGSGPAAHLLTGLPQQSHRLGNHISVVGGIDSSGHSLPGGLASRLVHGDRNAATIGNDDDDDDGDVLGSFVTERERQAIRERHQYEDYLRMRGGRDSDDLERRARLAASREIEQENQMQRIVERERADLFRRGYGHTVVERGTGNNDTAAPRTLVTGSAGYGYGQDNQPLSFALRSNRLNAATAAPSSSSSNSSHPQIALSSSASVSAMMTSSEVSPLRIAQQQLQQSVRGPRSSGAAHHDHDPGGVDSSSSSGGGPAATLRQMSLNGLD